MLIKTHEWIGAQNWLWRSYNNHISEIVAFLVEVETIFVINVLYFYTSGHRTQKLSIYDDSPFLVHKMYFNPRTGSRIFLYSDRPFWTSLQKIPVSQKYRINKIVIIIISYYCISMYSGKVILAWYVHICTWK